MYESNLKGTDKAIEIVDGVKEILIVLSKAIANFKAKLLSNEKMYNDTIGNVENEISELYQNKTLAENALSKNDRSIRDSTWRENEGVIGLKIKYVAKWH